MIFLTIELTEFQEIKHENYIYRNNFIIEDGAINGANSVIGPYFHIGTPVTIGENCKLLGHISIMDRTFVGNDNDFFDFSTIGCRTKDLKYVRGTHPSLKIGNHNVFREGSTVNCATAEGDFTIVWSFSNLLSDSHVAHDYIIGDHVILGCGCTAILSLTLGQCFTVI